MNKNLRIFTFLFTLLYFFSSTVLPALAAITYTYDQNGNMTSDGTECYEYNEANQLKKVKKCSNNQTIAEYVYDYNGTRVIKKVYSNGTLQKTVYSPSDDFETVKLASTGATQNTSYYIVNNEVVAKKNPDGTKQYYHNDHLGSTSVLTNQSGALVEKTEYDPWGEVKSGGTKSKFQYTGQEKDEETGLNYYNFRYYDSHIRRFTQPDDIIQDAYAPQTLNRYSYVQNNPLKYTDPTGHIAIVPMLLISGGVGIAAEIAELRLTNPNPAAEQWGMAIAKGGVTGLVAGFTGLGAGAIATKALAKTAISTGVQKLTSNVVVGGTASFVAESVGNKFSSKPLLHNYQQNIILGMATGGIVPPVAQKAIPNNRGPIPVKLDLSMTNLSSNRVVQTKQHAVNEVISNVIKTSTNFFLNLFKPVTKKK
jgi:RHS repeat-associated protein